MLGLSTLAVSKLPSVILRDLDSLAIVLSNVFVQWQSSILVARLPKGDTGFLPRRQTLKEFEQLRPKPLTGQPEQYLVCWTRAALCVKRKHDFTSDERTEEARDQR